MNILIAANENYEFPTRVFAKSLLENNKNNEINLYYMYSNLSDRAKKKMIKVFSEYENAHIEFLYIDENIFSNAPLDALTNKYITRETYYRLLMLDLLPKEIRRILYIDVDTIINRDINDLYQMELEEENVVAACEEYGFVLSPEIKDRVYNNLGLGNNMRYFNAGVMLIDICKMRKYYSTKQFFKTIDELQGKILFHDQDIMNLQLTSRTQFIDFRLYNCRPFFFKKTRINERKILKNAYIIHYGQKPWNQDFADMCLKIFWKYALKIEDGVELSAIIRKKQIQYHRERCVKIISKTILRNLKRTTLNY